jgi:hypothetical protein
MKPGKYTAKVIGAGMIPDDKNNEKPFMKFQTEAMDVITWYGNLSSPRGPEFDTKAAVAAGFIGENWKDFAQGLTHFEQKECSITVVEESYHDKKTNSMKKVTKVKYINPLGGDKLAEKALTSGQVKSNHSDFFKKAKLEAGVKSSSEEVPF